MPIPLGRTSEPNSANSASPADWHLGMTDEEADAPSYGAATKTAMHAATPVHAAVDGPATPDGSAAELAELMAAMGIDDTAVAAKTAQVVSSGWSTPVGSPPHNSYGCQWLNNDSCHWGSSGDSSDGGGSATNVGHLSGGTAQVPAPRSRRASREERAAREAARQASNNAFVASRQVIGNMKEEASKAFQMAIDARRKGRLAEAAQFEREAAFWKAEAAAYRKTAARDAFRHNNGAKFAMPDIDLHGLEVPVAMGIVRATLDAALKMAGTAAYSLVTVAFISGWGKHSPTGAKILPAIQDLLCSTGIDWELENPGKICALIRPDTY